MAWGVQFYGLVMVNTSFHFYRFGMILQAFGILPERYVAKILPISP